MGLDDITMEESSQSGNSNKLPLSHRRASTQVEANDSLNPAPPADDNEWLYAAQDRKLDKCMGTRVKIYSRRSLPPKWLGDEKRRKGHLDVHPSVHRSFQKMMLMQQEHMEDAKNPAPDSYVEPRWSY